MTKAKRRLTFDHPRELLLIEIARRCPACDAPARIGLTKAEARDYAGFECEACDGWNEDELAEGDVPEWWEELRVTGLNTPRARDDEGATECPSGSSPDDASGDSPGGSSHDASSEGSF